MGKTAVGDGYGYTTAINNVTQNDLLPVTQAHLTIPTDASVKLLFPGAKNAAWSMQGTFGGVEEGETISYTLNKPGGGTAQSLPHQSGTFTLSGTTLNESGAIYEILFGAAKPICKVTHSGVEHPFETLTLAKNYIETNNLTTATIEMLQDYQQPKTDVLEIPKNYNITLTTAKTKAEAEAAGETYYYVGENPSRATISRSSGDMSAAVRADIDASSVVTWDETESGGTHATTSLTVHHIIFDGKALGQGGEGGAIKAANVKVYVHHCGFKGYNADFGGALYTKWGQLTVEHCDFNKCQARGGVDKTGGGGIWTTAQKLTVDGCTFTDCSCLDSPAQGGAVFHNIRKKDAIVHPGNNQKPADNQKFPDGFSDKSETTISNCVFHSCIAKLGSGGTIESDAKIVTIEYCEFYDSEARKANGANGGAINIYTNDNSPQADSSLTVRGCYFNHCSAYSSNNTKNSNGGAVRAICKSVSLIDSVFIDTYTDNRGGALSMSTAGTNLLIQGCTIDNSRADKDSGAIYANATKVTIEDSTFNNCRAPSYGGVYHTSTGDLEVKNSSFEDCHSNGSEGGALYTKTKNLSISGMYGGKSITFPGSNFTTTYAAKAFTFKNCTATKEGGAVYNNNSGTSQVLTNCVFDGCSSGTSGGGAYLAATTIKVSGGEVKNCYATNNGGGLYISPTNATFTDNYSFDNNWVTASDSKGGALFINQGTVTMTGGTVSDSKAAYGGGIYNKGTLTISKGTGENGGTITNCVARISGGGIYTTGNVTLDGAEISECYAVTSGGGMYQESGELKLYGTITRCYAPTGGGLYSKGGKITITDASKSMEISDCHATTVNIADDGTPSATMEYSSDNKGGGIFRVVGSNEWKLNLPTATIKDCTAYDGGGVYLNNGPWTYSNGNFYGNTATNNGGAIYKNGGTATISGGVIGGSTDNANHAQLGSGIFVANGQSITIGGGRITHNVAEVGGAVAVGGTNTQLFFQKAPAIRNNTNANGDNCNVYLNYDTNSIIRTNGTTALDSGAYIGVYVTDDQFAKHGNYGMPFGTYGKTDNLSSFYNDRIYAGGLKGSSSQIVWGEFVCKITDAEGNLLYVDAGREAPAVYTKLENIGAAELTSAFGMLSYSTVKLYNESGIYSGPYQIQMLVGDYPCKGQMKLANGSKDITLTTASRTPDECGFCYTGAADQAVIRRGANYGSMIDTTNMSRLVIENITVDGGSENSYKSNTAGGIISINGGTEVNLKENTLLCNSNAGTYNGAGISMASNNGNKLIINGAEISNCVSTAFGGGIWAIKGTITMNSGRITECLAQNGGGIYLDTDASMTMSGGSITENTATSEAGGIDLRGTIRFSGNPVVSGNTLNGSTPCNLHLIEDSNSRIYADGLGPFAEIRVYTAGTIRTNHGEKGDPFGTWTNNENLHCFINDVTPALRGMKTENEDDYDIYWRDTPFLSVAKAVESDWAADKDKEFEFTVTIVGQEDFSGSYENMTFENGVATFKLKAGQVRTAIGLPFEFIHNGVHYIVAETLAEGQTAYTTEYSHNGAAPVSGKTVEGHFGENMSDDQLTSSSVSSVSFTNTRAKDDLTVSKIVTEGITGDYTMPFTFTVTLDDKTITKAYNTKHYQDETDSTGTDETLAFTNGEAEFQLTHGQSLKIQGLPKELGFKVEEKLTDDQYANFRTYVTADSSEELLSSSSTGKIGELKQVAFRNNRYGLVCKIVNDTAGREQLYYRDNNNPTADPTPAIYDELEKAFEAISGGISFFTANGASADTKLRVEMVKPHYKMNRQATLANGCNVTLGTAQKTDRLYPYPTDAESPAVVTRGFEGGSMIVDYGNLTLDNITLDGGSDGSDGSDTYTANENGGIVQVDGAQILTVTEKAILRNSVSTGNRGGGAIWLNEHAGLVMNGSITQCQAKSGGGVYAEKRFGGVSSDAGYVGLTISGSISNCEATAGNGGAIYAGTTNISTNIPNAVPMLLTGSAMLTGNKAFCVEGEDDTGRGGAIYCAASITIDSANVSVSGNTAEKDGGGIYQSSESTFTMNGGTIIGNVAETGNAGGLWANRITITDGEFSGNKANGKTVTQDGSEQVENGRGGAIYTKTGSVVTIKDATFTGNEAYQGGAIYDQAKTFTITDVNMTGNIAIKNGGAVYVASAKTEEGSVKTGSFDMNGGSITGNKSPEGAVSTGSDAVLNFSGNVKVFGNTADDDTTAMNVFLGYHSNTIINASGLTGNDQIGVYVKDGEDKSIYYNHGIANRPFGTGSGDNLNKFVNDRDNSLTGVQGPEGLIMWPGKDLVIQVCQYKVDNQGQRITPATPVGGAKFSLATEKTDDSKSIIIWSGESDASTGLLTIPWGITEEENGSKANFTKKDENGVTPATYILSELEAGSDTVRPAGSWKLTIAPDNAVTWTVILPESDKGQGTPEGGEGQGGSQGGEGQEGSQNGEGQEGSQGSEGQEGSQGSEGQNGSEEAEALKVNRIIEVEPKSGAFIGATFLLYNDVEPTITFDPNGGILSGNTDSSTRTELVDFSPSELNHTCTIEEHNPTRENAVFRIWSTVKNPTEGDGHKEYKQGDEILFYRHTDNDDLTLYALWTTVVCKITDREDNLLYVNGSPAVYMSLKEGFDDFNGAQLTYKDGTRATPRKLKMLVPEYEMPESVELTRGKIMEFMTASNEDTDGYKGPDTTCVITRTASFDTGSMITDNYNLVLRNITLDGAVKGSSGNVNPIDGNGGIITVIGKSSHLTLAQGATLQNAVVSGKGGAIYAYGNTTINVSEGSTISGCQAVNGGAIFADSLIEGSDPVPGIVNISGGEIKGNKAATADEGMLASGGGIYATGTVSMAGGSVEGNTAASGGGLYVPENARFSITGGSFTGNSAVNGGGVYADGSVTLSNNKATISGNTASANGGGVYVSENGSFTLSAGSIGESGKENTAVNGGGVYLAGKAQLIGGSIIYNTTTEDGSGGGLYIAGVPGVELSGTEVSYNHAANGGGVYVNKPQSGGTDDDFTLFLTKGAVANNTASGNGGGVYLTPGVSFSMTGGALDANAAQNGGGVYVVSGSDMTLTGGTINRNTVDCGTDYSTGNGAAIYVEGSNSSAYGILRVKSGTISDNAADTFGGAVYLQGYSQLHVSGGEISGNAAGNTNGGAINAEGVDARIYLSGTPTIFNNPGNANTTAQKNLVLSVGQTYIINTEGNGLDPKESNGTMLRAAVNVTGIVGIYAIDENDVFTEHGVYDKPFGTFGDEDDKRINAKNLVNDRLLSLHGVEKEAGNSTIYWQDAVCKVTDTNDVLLYQRVNVADSGLYVYAPAVYTRLKNYTDDSGNEVQGGIDAANGSLYRKVGDRYYTVNNIGLVKIKMLRDYTLSESEVITYDAARDITLTTAETMVTTVMEANRDSFVYAPATGVTEGERLTKATLTRNQTTSPMFTVSTSSNSFTVTDLIIDGGSTDMMTTDEVNGGAFNITSVKTATFSNVTIKNMNATGNGGAIYAGAGTVAVNNGSTFTNCQATNGGAVYVVNGATMSLEGTSATATTITGNTATAGGAGIYLAEGSTLKLSGNPNFGGTGTGDDGNIITTSGNIKAGDLTNEKNGGKSYTRARQDIFLAEKDTDPASIVLTGDLTGEPGSVWVWAENEKHYQMLKPFAVINEGATISNSTYLVFRNAQTDDHTLCGGDTYLTGQTGDNKSFVYWTGGFDVLFKKIDGYGSELVGATFTLYRNAECTEIYQQNNAAVTASSVDANSGVKYSKNGVETELGEGMVLFAKVPAGVYYMKETEAPQDYTNAVNTDSAGKFVANVYLLLVGETALNSYSTYDLMATDITAQTEKYTELYGLKDYAIFLCKWDDTNKKFTEKAVATPDIATYGIMNISTKKYPVMLSKVVINTLKALPGATLRILRYDRSVVAPSLKSDSSGIFYIGELPYGTYLVEETAPPDGYQKPTTYFVFKIDENGVHDETASIPSSTLTKVVDPSTHPTDYLIPQTSQTPQTP